MKSIHEKTKISSISGRLLKKCINPIQAKNSAGHYRNRSFTRDFLKTQMCEVK